MVMMHALICQLAKAAAPLPGLIDEGDHDILMLA